LEQGCFAGRIALAPERTAHAGPADLSAGTNAAGADVYQRSCRFQRRTGSRPTKKAEAERLQRQAKLEQDMAWGAHHEEDTDEQLLHYLRCCAQHLGHTPVVREVEGGGYIAKRFINWPLALHLAQLPLPQGMLPHKAKDFYQYQQTAKLRAVHQVWG
jgi:hypothetical protein